MIYIAEVYQIWLETTNWFGAWTNTANSCCNRSYTDSDIQPLIVIFPFPMLLNIWVTWRVSYERHGSPPLPAFFSSFFFVVSVLLIFSFLGCVFVGLSSFCVLLPMSLDCLFCCPFVPVFSNVYLQS
jgi:hypothetical protein